MRSRLLVAVRAVVVLASVAVLAGSGWGWDLLGVAEASVHRGDALPAAGNTDVSGAGHAGQAMNLLLVGMDSRAGLSDAQEDANSTGGSDGELNTDTMILVHVPADGAGVSFASLPRDTYVTIPGYGPGKLNAAYADAHDAADGDARARDSAGMGLLDCPRATSTAPSGSRSTSPACCATCCRPTCCWTRPSNSASWPRWGTA